VDVAFAGQDVHCTRICGRQGACSVLDYGAYVVWMVGMRSSSGTRQQSRAGEVVVLGLPRRECGSSRRLEPPFVVGSSVMTAVSRCPRVCAGDRGGGVGVAEVAFGAPTALLF
jgi:hypothetical protein